MAADDRLAPSDAPNAWALEGGCAPHIRRPGVLYASHPLFATEDAALDAAAPRGRAAENGARPARVLVRFDGGAWQVNPRQVSGP